MKTLCIIPARGGSKGIPHKNIKPLAGKPLIMYAVDAARKMFADADICVTTDDEEIKSVVESSGLKVPFLRPDYLATDNCGTYEVLLHAVDFYKKLGIKYDTIVLLQPTSPFRSVENVRKAVALYTPECDMVVSVVEADSNPYYNLFEENEEGFLFHSKGDGDIVRRQDAPKVYEYNGAVYVIKVDALLQSPVSKFKSVRKYVMSKEHSLDLDTPLDWQIAEILLSNKK